MACPVAVEPVKTILSTPECSASGAPASLSGPGHDVDHAGRHTRLVHQIRDQQWRQRRLFGGLEHDGAAGRERRADLPHRCRRGCVPGDDGANDAHRLLSREGDDVTRKRIVDRLPVDRGGHAGVISEHAEHAKLVRPRPDDRHAHVSRVGLADLLPVLLEEVGDPQQQRLPLKRLEAAPRAVKRPTGRGDGKADVGRVATRHATDHLACRRIARLEDLPRAGFYPCAIDEHLAGSAVDRKSNLGFCHWSAPVSTEAAVRCSPSFDVVPSLQRFFASEAHGCNPLDALARDDVACLIAARSSPPPRVAVGVVRTRRRQSLRLMRPAPLARELLRIVQSGLLFAKITALRGDATHATRDDHAV